MIIAIDGPAAAGKGTLALQLAERLGFAYLDTGLLYRATAARVLAGGGDPNDPVAAAAAAGGVSAADLARADLRSEAVSAAASQVAAIPGVRAALLDFQRTFAACPPQGAPGAVIDGRDIGTVVCPDAGFKLFVTASLDARAERRLLELQGQGIAADFATIKRDMAVRDERDRNRGHAPLRPAQGAFILDTSSMSVAQALATALAFIRRAGGPG